MADGAVIKRSRFVGLRDFYVALVTENTTSSYVTGTPYKLARAIKAKISDKRSTEDLESDDGTEETLDAYEGTEVEIEVNSLAPQDLAFLFGHTFENGYLMKSADDKAPDVALGYREKKLNGKYEFVWLYVGKFAEGRDENRETKRRKPTVQTETIKGKFHEREIDGLYDVRVDEDNLVAANTGAAAAIADWFSQVQEPATTA
jgi:phi13 family phage major tail protein